MTDELLRRIRDEVSAGTKKYADYYDKLIHAEQLPKVKIILEESRSRALERERNRLICDAYFRILLEKSKENATIENTNKVFYYAGARLKTGKTTSGKDFWIQISEERLEKYDKNLISKVYIDIESGETIKLLIADSLEFEKNNICVFGDNVENLRLEFIDMSLKTNQETAVQELVKKHGKGQSL